MEVNGLSVMCNVYNDGRHVPGEVRRGLEGGPYLSHTCNLSLWSEKEKAVNKCVWKTAIFSTSLALNEQSSPMRITSFSTALKTTG